MSEGKGVGPGAGAGAGVDGDGVKTDAGASDGRGGLSALERLFSGALEQPAGPRRRRWVERASGGDAALVEQVMGLLDAHVASDGFLERGALVDASPAPLEDLEVGSRIGPYTLEAELGEGGFGVVFRASQERPIRREVALKVIKLGMDTKQVIARFEAERQALALMDHPSIARVLDAGATERGRPYFVMDLAPGQAITDYCDTRRLGLRDRLRLFVELCAAVQHAHLRGVIHRDLKPSNVLVQELEGRHVPKVIDFGIAKATTSESGQGTLFTEMGQVIGTPVYMSPEQAAGNTDIDTRTDVYALGVVLHELLAGETPFSAAEIREHAGAGDIGTFLAEQAPTPMTARVEPTREGATEVARLRRTTAGDLRRSLKGDLESVVQCALSPERQRRYQSVGAFSSDVQRVLDDRPIEAAPPSTIYRLGKFLRRHRVATVAGAAVVAALLFGLIVAFQSLQARRDQAEVLREIFSATRYSDVAAGGGSLPEAAEPAELDRMVRGAFGAEDSIRVDALATLAGRLVSAGMIEAGIAAQEQALQAAREIHGPRTGQAARQQAALGLLRARGGDLRLATSELADALALDRDLGAAPSTVLHEARLELARALEESGDRDQAMALLREADELASAVEVGDGSLRIEALERLAELTRRAGDVDATRAHQDELLRLYARRYAEDSAYLVGRYVEYARWLASVGLTEEASLPLDVALDNLDRTAAPSPGLLLETLTALNRLYTQDPSLATVAGARESLERELSVAAERFAPDSNEYVETLARCAASFERLGDLGRSTELLIERFERFEASTASNPRADAAQRARTVLAEQLLERADAVRRQGGLPIEAYRAARRAGELIAPYFPGNRNLLETRMVLATRTGEFSQMLSLLSEFERSIDVEGGHPLTLAMQAIALHQTPATERLARQSLSRAQDLARKPEFATLPGLQEALDWAAEVIYGNG